MSIEGALTRLTEAVKEFPHLDRLAEFARSTVTTVAAAKGYAGTFWDFDQISCRTIIDGVVTDISFVEVEDDIVQCSIYEYDRDLEEITWSVSMPL